MDTKKITTYQLFRREFIEPKNGYLEWSFTYLLKCFYFPKHFRPEYLKWTENHAEKLLWEELTGGNFNQEEQLIFTDKIKEKEWGKLVDNAQDYLVNNFSKEFIKYGLSFTPYSSKEFNIPTNEQVEKLYKAFQLVPKVLKEKQPWYPLSYCDFALDDYLIEVKWTDDLEIKEEYVRKLEEYYNAYELWTLRKIGIYFAKQGKLWICDMLGKCPSDLKEIAQSFKELPMNILLPEKISLKEVANISRVYKSFQTVILSKNTPF